MQNFQIQNFPRIFLITCSLVGVGLVLAATSKYGAGLAGDSIHYLSVAESLLQGRGFIDFAGNPLILFPPLLSIVIAGLAWVFRLDVFLVGWGFNALVFGLNIYLSGHCLERVFRARPVYFFAATLIILFSSSNLALHASILTDPLYLTLTLLFFLAGERYIIKPAWQPWLGMLVLAILAPLLRFSGFAQIVSGSLIIVYAHGRKFLKGVPLAGIFGFISLLPTALWIYLHNYLPYGTFWGTNNAAGADVLVNLLQSLRKMMYWFVPYRPISRDGFIEPVVILVVVVIGLLLVNKLRNWREAAQELLRPIFISMLILTAVYYSSSILNIQTNDHKALFSDRYFVIIMVPVLVAMLVGFDRLVLPHIPFRPRVLQFVLPALFLVWLIYPLSKEFKYLLASMQNGEAGYNQYNTRAMRTSALLSGVKELLLSEPQANLYSNIPPAVWFYTRHTVFLPPAQDVRRTRDEIKDTFAGWPYDRPGYYIWFEPDPFELFMPLDDLYLVAGMEIVRPFQDGSIVRVWARGSR